MGYFTPLVHCHFSVCVADCGKEVESSPKTNACLFQPLETVQLISFGYQSWRASAFAKRLSQPKYQILLADS